MKSGLVAICVSLLLSLQFWGTAAFTNQHLKVHQSRSNAVSNTQLFFFGAPKDDGSPGDYVCKVRHDT
jgi:hypothetical protein